jgi:hypothetical protein
LISRKALLLGVCLMVGNVFLMFQTESVTGARVTFVAPFPNVLFLLTLLTGANIFVKRYKPRLALTSVELLALYVVLSVQSAISSIFFTQWIIRSITHGFWYDTADRANATKYGPYLPAWFTVQDRNVLAGFYNGNSSLFTRSHLLPWLAPILAWTLFFCAMGIVFLATATLFAQQWIRHERLTFPIVELPFQMVAPDNAFWRQRLMWLGFALAASIELLNGLNYWFPALPFIPVKINDLSPLFTSKPWNGIGDFNISFYPFIIGICYIAPLDLCFSAVFFYLLIKVECVLGTAQAWDANPQYPYYWEQSFGAVCALLMATLWGSRKHLREIARRAFGHPADERDPAEARLYRRSLLAAGLGSLFLVVWLMLAGLQWWAAGVMVLVWIGGGVVAARIRAESGFPQHYLDDMSGTILLMTAVGGNAFGMRSITLMALFNGFTKFNTYHMMPHQVEGFRLAGRTGLRAEKIAAVMLLTILLSVPMTLLINIASFYHLGAGARAHAGLFLGQDTWLWTMPRWTSGDSTAAGISGGKPNWHSLGMIAISFTFCNMLMMLRYRLLWFPLHPIGMVLGNGMRMIWFSVLVAALIKWITLRYGGLRSFRAVLPFFLGLILGDILIGMSWMVLGLLLQVPTYAFFP